MEHLQYKFDDLKIKNNNYILQLVFNKKLSEVYHSHNFYEMLIILQGEVIHTINSNDYKMSKGDGVLLFPGDEHYFKWQSADLELLGLSVLKDEFEIFYKGFDFGYLNHAKKPTTTFFFSCEYELVEIQHMAMKYYKKPDNFLDCKLLLCFILHNMFDLHLKDDSAIPTSLKNAVKSMREPNNIKEGLSALLRLSNYSYPHLYRLFKKYYHQTPHDFILNLRLESAYSQLVFSDLSIEKIMLNLGYSSLSNFHSIFKKKYGMTPNELRKQNVLQKTI